MKFRHAAALVLVGYWLLVLDSSADYDANPIVSEDENGQRSHKSGPQPAWVHGLPGSCLSSDLVFKPLAAPTPIPQPKLGLKEPSK